MKSKWLARIVVLIACWAMTLTACATTDQKRAAGDGGLGATIDTATGGGKVLGALIEGAFGKVKGALIVHQLERLRAEVVASNRYTPKQGHRLIVERAEVVPAVARPGDEVRVKVRYSVLAPDSQATIPVTETWQFLFKNQPVGEPIRKPKENRTQGGYSSTYKFKVTPDFPRGTYQVLVTISNGTTSRSIVKTFSM